MGGGFSLFPLPQHLVGGEVARAKRVTERGTMVRKQNGRRIGIRRRRSNFASEKHHLYCFIPHHCPPLRHALRARHLSPALRRG